MPAHEVRASDLPVDAALVDVRGPWEWAAGHVEGSVHLPVGELQGRLGELPAGALVVVCRSGHRSGQVADWLVDPQRRTGPRRRAQRRGRRGASAPRPPARAARPGCP